MFLYKVVNVLMFDDDYLDLFITQTPREENVISLEEDKRYIVVESNEYLFRFQISYNKLQKLLVQYMIFLDK